MKELEELKSLVQGFVVGSSVKGRWLCEKTQEALGHNPDRKPSKTCYWEPYNEEEQEAWLETVAENGRKALSLVKEVAKKQKKRDRLVETLYAALCDVRDELANSHEDEIRNRHYGDGASGCLYCKVLKQANKAINKKLAQEVL